MLVAAVMGGLLILSSTVAMSRNLVRFNSAGFSGSGVYAESDSDVALINDVVADNWVDDDVFSFDCAIYVGLSSVSMLHTTIARNEGGEGTGVCVHTSTTTSTAALTNTIIADHVVGIDVAAGSQAVLRGILWQGNGTNSVGNVARTDDRAGNPAFAPDGYRLTSQSAAIDQGVDTALTSDIDLEARPGGASYDVGADEWQPNHSVDLAGFCDGLASAPVTTVVTVGDVPVVGLEAANSSANTLGETTWFTAAITAGGNVTYRWSFDDGQMGSGRAISHTYGVTGIYTTVVTASNTVGEVSAFTVVRVEEGARLVLLPLVVKTGARTLGAGRAGVDAGIDARGMQLQAAPQGPTGGSDSLTEPRGSGLSTATVAPAAMVANIGSGPGLLVPSVGNAEPRFVGHLPPR